MKNLLLSGILALSVAGTAMADTAPDTKPAATAVVKTPKAAKSSKVKKAKTTDTKTAVKAKTVKKPKS